MTDEEQKPVATPVAEAVAEALTPTAENIEQVEDAIKEAGVRKIQLKPCPCGVVPRMLMINCADRAKYGQMTGDCCGEWTVDFKNGYASDKQVTQLKAVTAWNDAPRGMAVEVVA